MSPAVPSEGDSNRAFEDLFSVGISKAKRSVVVGIRYSQIGRHGASGNRSKNVAGKGFGWVSKYRDQVSSV